MKDDYTPVARTLRGAASIMLNALFELEDAEFADKEHDDARWVTIAKLQDAQIELEEFRLELTRKGVGLSDEAHGRGYRAGLAVVADPLLAIDSARQTAVHHALVRDLFDGELREALREVGEAVWHAKSVLRDAGALK